MIAPGRWLRATTVVVVALSTFTPAATALAAGPQATTQPARSIVPHSATGTARSQPYAVKSQSQDANVKVPQVPGAVAASGTKPVIPPDTQSAARLGVGQTASSITTGGDKTIAGLPKGLTADSVEVPSARTGNSSTFANLDGSYTTKVYEEPVHFRDASGIWQDISTALRQSAKGRHTVAADDTGVSFADSSTASDLMTAQIDASHSISFELIGAAPTPGQSDGSTMTYHDILPSSDLALTSTRQGMKEAIVLKSAAAPRSWTFAMHLQGLTARLDAHGDLYLYDASNTIRGVVPHGWMEDSNIDPHAGQGQVSDGVKYQLLRLPSGEQALRVTVDSAWLNDPARVYPVTVDPSELKSSADLDDTYVMSNFDANYDGESELHVGTYDGGTHNGAAYLHFGSLGWLAYAHVLDAQLKMWEVWSWSCVPSGVSVYGVVQGWDGTTMRSWPGASYWGRLAQVNAAHGYSKSSCPADWVNFHDDNLTGLVDDWVNGRVANNGLTVRSDSATDSNSWKKFSSREVGPEIDYLDITWSPYNATYAPTTTWVQPLTNTQPGKIYVDVTNTGQTTWTANSTFKLGYHIYDSTNHTAMGFTTYKTVIPTTTKHGQTVRVLATINPMPPGQYTIRWDMADDGTAWFEDQGVPYYAQPLTSNEFPTLASLSPADGDAVGSLTPTLTLVGTDPDNYPGQGLKYQFEVCTGSDANSGACWSSGWTSSNTWKPPAGALQWRQSYYWRGQVNDGQLSSAWSYPSRITTSINSDGHLGSDAYAPLVGNVNPLTGNYTTSVTDAAVKSSAGPDVSLQRTYNSLNAADGPLGRGWSTPLSMRLAPDGSGNLSLTYGDGHALTFGRNPDGNYAAPEGYFSTLRAAPILDGAFTGDDAPTSLGAIATGQTWSPLSGNWGISNHRAYLSTAGTGHSLVVTQGSTDGSISFTEPVSAAGLGVALHVQDTNNYLRLVANPPSKNWQLIKRVNGSDSVLGTTGANTCCTAGDTLRIDYSGSTTTVYRNNSQILRIQDSASGLYQATRIGLAADTTSSGRVANFSAAGNIDVESFTNQPNSTSNLGLTDSGGAWQQLSGTWGVTGGSAYLSAAQANGSLAVTNGAPDGTFDVNITSVQPGSGLAFRVTDKNNFWRIAADTTTSTWKLIKRVGGTDTVVATQSIACADNHYQLRLADARISFGCDQPGALHAVDTAFANQTQIGLYAETTGNARWDHLTLSTASILTDKSGTSYQFNAAGKISRTLDGDGNATTFSYDTNGHLAHVVNDTSGRGLTLDWTGEHITSVNTDPVDVGQGPLTWTYGYTGSLLTSVTAPSQSTSTVYAYTTTAPTDLLNQITLPSGNISAKMGYRTDGTIAWTEDGLGHRSSYSKTSNQTSTTAVFTDPNSHASHWVYDKFGRLTQHTDAENHSRTFRYNDLGYLTTVVDENNDTLALTTDDRGNILTRTTARQAGQSDTSYYSYFLGAPGDPRNDKITVERDARSSSATDNRYATTSTYDVNGQLLRKTGPATPDQPAGSTTAYSYSIGNETASDSGTIPAGLVVTSTDARGKVTTYDYAHNGDLTHGVMPSGLSRDYSYDGIGRVLDKTETSDSYPAGLNTSYTYDAASQVTSITEPPVTNPITGVTHTKQTSYTYDKDENPTVVTVSDTTGGDTPRVTHLYYDGDDRLFKQVDPTGGTTLTSYDSAGNVASRTDANSTITTYSYSPRNELWQTTIKNFIDDPVNPGTPRDVVTDSRGYDPGGRLSTETDALGHTTASTYYADDLLRSTTLTGYREPTPTTGQLGPSTRDITLSRYQYDAAGNPTSVTTNGMVTQKTFDAADRATSSILDPSGLARTTALHYDATGNVTQQILTAAGTSDSRTTSTSYTDAGLAATSTLSNDATPDLVTSYGYDQRGLQTSSTDPRGYRAGQSPDPAFTTSTTFDEAGRPISVQLPAVNTETNGDTPVTTRPTTSAGYDTFGDLTQTTDADGNTTAISYDALGRVDTITYPSYTPKGSSTAIVPTESFGYDHNGNITSHTDRRGQTTTATYDMRNRMITVVEPAATSGGTHPTARYTYDDNNQQLAVTSPTGAKTAQAYDDLGRVWATSDYERTPANAIYTTYTLHDDRGNITRLITPDNVGSGNSETATYNAANELTSTTDEAGRTTLYGRTLTGDVASITDNAGRKAVYGYDKAGRLQSLTEYDHTGAPLRSRSVVEDGAGNITSATTPNGFTTTKIYDAVNQLTKVTQPLTATTSAVTSYGYDAAGNRTRVTNPNNNPTITTYNSLGLPEDVIEPSTTAHPALADRTTTTLYNAAGDVASVLKPGAVTVTSSYDNLGQLTSQTGGGAETATTGKSFGYDLDGRLTSFSVTGGTETIGYNDRGLAVSATGAAGDATFSYDASGLETSRTDAAGTGTFTYNPDASLATALDSSTGATATYGYDSVGNLHTTSYGTGNVTRSYGYDDLNRLTSDTLASGGGTVLRSDSYGYDNDDNRTSRTISPAIKGSGTNTYTYDQADRLTSWIDPSNTTKTYSYDPAGNRTKVNSTTSTYDARNELLSQGNTDFTYNARGDLTSTTTGNGTTTNQVFDAFDRMVSDDNIDYTYDALDRITSHNGKTTLYAGTETEPVADTNQTFSRDPGGQLLGFKTATTAREIFTDAHQDVVSTFEPDATSIGAQIVYDPYGNTLATAGTVPDVGYQSSWTDPGTDRINMQARWYGPGRADFLSSDTYDVPNKYNYANDNPFSGVDRTGHGLPGPFKIILKGAEKWIEPAEIFVDESWPTPVADGTCSGTGSCWPNFVDKAPHFDLCEAYVIMCYPTGYQSADPPGHPNYCVSYYPACVPTPAPSTPGGGGSYPGGGYYGESGSSHPYGGGTPLPPPPPPRVIKPTHPAPPNIWDPTPQPADPAGGPAIQPSEPPAGSALHVRCTTKCASDTKGIVHEAPDACVAPQGAGAMLACTPSDAVEDPTGSLEPQVATDGTGTAEDGALFSRSAIRTNTDLLKNGGGLPRTMETVQAAARSGGVSLQGIDLQIVNDPEFATYLDTRPGGPAIARTDQFGIQLGPASFTNEETLIRTLAHERMHVYQIATFGSSSALTDAFEQAAYGIEQSFVDYWRAGGLG